MSEAKTFKDKVDIALRDVMRHAVAGDEKDASHTFCNSADHALHILAEHGLTLMNAHVAAHILDNQ